MQSHLGWRHDLPPAETTMSLPIADVEPLLGCIHDFSHTGLALAHSHEIVGRAVGLELDEEWEKTFTVQNNGQLVDLHIRIIMERLSHPTLIFRGPAALVQQIDRAMEQFMDESET